MPFKQRAIKVNFFRATGTLSDGVSTSVELTGHRCEAIVLPIGPTLAAGNAALRIWGMKMADMRSFSTDALNALAVRKDQVTVSVGDVGGNIQQIFEGTKIGRAHV